MRPRDKYAGHNFTRAVEEALTRRPNRVDRPADDGERRPNRIDRVGGPHAAHQPANSPGRLLRRAVDGASRALECASDLDPEIAIELAIQLRRLAPGLGFTLTISERREPQ